MHQLDPKRRMVGLLVEVYRNLTRNCYSVRSVETGRVQAHVTEFCLHDCEFRVSEAGRQRVLRERRKNVHAVIRGILVNANYWHRGIRRAPWPPMPLEGAERVTYNPYEVSKFQASGADILEAAMVWGAVGPGSFIRSIPEAGIWAAR